MRLLIEDWRDLIIDIGIICNYLTFEINCLFNF